MTVVVVVVDDDYVVFVWVSPGKYLEWDHHLFIPSPFRSIIQEPFSHSSLRDI